jgi:hypothetical protein
MRSLNIVYRKGTGIVEITFPPRKKKRCDSKNAWK